MATGKGPKHFPSFCACHHISVALPRIACLEFATKRQDWNTDGSIVMCEFDPQILAGREYLALCCIFFCSCVI